MKDLSAKLEKLQADAEDCLLISRLATAAPNRSRSLISAMLVFMEQ